MDAPREDSIDTGPATLFGRRSEVNELHLGGWTTPSKEEPRTVQMNPLERGGEIGVDGHRS